MTTLAALIAAVRDANETNPGDYVDVIAAEQELVDYLLAHVPAADTEARLNEIRGDFSNWLNTPRTPDSQTQQMLQAIDFLLALKDPFYPARYDDEVAEKRELEREMLKWRKTKDDDPWDRDNFIAARDALVAFLVAHAGADA